MKKQFILLLIASAAVGNLDAAANRFYNWCINNRSRLGLLSGAALSSGTTAYYWNNRNQQPKEDIEICGNEPAHNPESKLVPDLVYGCKCKDYPSCKCWGKIKKDIHIIPTYNLPAYSSERHQ